MPQGTRRERDRQGRDNDYNRKNKDQKQKKGETSGAKKEREVKEVRIVSTLRFWIWPTSMIDNFFFLASSSIKSYFGYLQQQKLLPIIL